MTQTNIYGRKLLDLLQQKLQTYPTTIYQTKEPFALTIDFLRNDSSTNHKYYFSNTSSKSYLRYFNDQHADIQLHTENLPDALYNSFGKFCTPTAVVSNNGVAENNTDATQKPWPKMHPLSHLWQGLFTFSKAFLCENYVLNQDQQLANIIFQAICDYNHLRPNEWVFQGSLHKNTALFHFHFRMYQTINARTLHLKNFSPSCQKYVKNCVENYFRQIQQTNNQQFNREFKIQQLYIKFAQENGLNMNLMNMLIDLAQTDASTFNTNFRNFLINLLIIQDYHQAQLDAYRAKLNSIGNSIFNMQKDTLQKKLHQNLITQDECKTALNQWKTKIETFKTAYYAKWIAAWSYHVLEEINSLWTKKVKDVCAHYETLINSKQQWHTLKPADREKTFSELSTIPNVYRKRYHKAILYLSSKYLIDHLVFDDRPLIREVDELYNTMTLETVLTQPKELFVGWSAQHAIQIQQIEHFSRSLITEE